MYPSHDMNPLAIEHMRRERLAADIERVDRGASIPFRGSVAAIAVLLVLAVAL